VTREGRATLKFVSGNGLAGSLAMLVTNQTFSITLVGGEQVKYEVESVNKERGTV
jgi:hypothetical protein